MVDLLFPKLASHFLPKPDYFIPQMGKKRLETIEEKKKRNRGRE